MALSGIFTSYISGAEFGLKCVWSATQNTRENQSTITLSTYLHYRNISVGARTSQDCWIDDNKSEYNTAAISNYPDQYTDTLLYTKTYTVTHGADGNRNVWLSSQFEFNGSYNGISIGTLTASITVSLDWINRYPPTVTLALSEITATSVKVTATTNVPCCTWNYSKGDGWVWYENQTSPSSVYTITGLTAGTNYSVGIRAFRDSNYVAGEAWLNFTTLGSTYPVATSGAKWTPFAIDTTTATLSMKWHSYVAGYYHWVEFLTGASTLLAEWTNVQASGTGDTTKTLNFSSGHRTAVAANMNTVKAKTYWVRITTYSGSGKTGQIGSPTSIEVDATTSAANSGPSLASMEYHDYNTNSVAVTGNNQYIIRLASYVHISASGATAKFGASITGYSATVHNTTLSGVSNAFDMGGIDTGSNATASITVYDSRGYSKTLTKTVTVIDYRRPSSSITVRRQNGVDNIIQLEVSGSIASVLIGGTQKNSLQLLFWVYKGTNGEWPTGGSGDHYLTPTINGLGYSFEDMDLTDSANTFDVENSYNFRVYVLDAFGWDTYEVQEFLISQATPLMSIRPKKIGINKLNPTVAMDIVGGLRVDGFDPITYKFGIGEDEDLNDYKDTGVYVVAMNATATTIDNIPVATAGTLEVISAGGVFVLQRYTVFDGDMYFRTCYGYDGSWQTWKHVTST